MTDRERLRADVDNIDSSRTGRLLTSAAGVLVECLDHHMRREEAWVTNPADEPLTDTDDEWALPLLMRIEGPSPAQPGERLACVIRAMRPTVDKCGRSI